jgi:hypothetical protein
MRATHHGLIGNEGGVAATAGTTEQRPVKSGSADAPCSSRHTHKLDVSDHIKTVFAGAPQRD